MSGHTCEYIVNDALSNRISSRRTVINLHFIPFILHTFFVITIIKQVPCVQLLINFDGLEMLCDACGRIRTRPTVGIHELTARAILVKLVFVKVVLRLIVYSEVHVLGLAAEVIRDLLVGIDLRLVQFARQCTMRPRNSRFSGSTQRTSHSILITLRKWTGVHWDGSADDAVAFGRFWFALALLAGVVLPFGV